MTIWSDKLATYVWVFMKNSKGEYSALHLDENYFTLTANRKKTISVGSLSGEQLFVTCYELEVNAEKKNNALLTEEQ